MITPLLSTKRYSFLIFSITFSVLVEIVEASLLDNSDLFGECVNVLYIKKVDIPITIKIERLVSIRLIEISIKLDLSFNQNI